MILAAEARPRGLERLLAIDRPHRGRRSRRRRGKDGRSGSLLALHAGRLRSATRHSHRAWSSGSRRPCARTVRSAHGQGSVRGLHRGSAAVLGSATFAASEWAVPPSTVVTSTVPRAAASMSSSGKAAQGASCCVCERLGSSGTGCKWVRGDASARTPWRRLSAQMRESTPVALYSGTSSTTTSPSCCPSELEHLPAIWAIRSSAGFSQRVRAIDTRLKRHEPDPR